MKLSIDIAIIILLVFHFICDFGFQTRYQADNKSKSLIALTEHVSVYAISMSFIFLILGKILNIEDIYSTMMIATIITFVAHWITDFFTSKLSSHFHKKGKIHAFFVTIGADQYIFHIPQLILTLKYLYYG